MITQASEHEQRNVDRLSIACVAQLGRTPDQWLQVAIEGDRVAYLNAY